MPRNLHGGNKAKRGANKNAQPRKGKDDTPIPDENEKQYVGQIASVFGDCRYNAKLINKECAPDKELMVHLAGSLKRRCRVMVGSIVLISHRDFENKGDILYVYTADDKEYLISKGYIFENNNSYDGSAINDDDLGFSFANSNTAAVDSSEFDIVIDGL